MYERVDFVGWFLIPATFLITPVQPLNLISWLSFAFCSLWIISLYIAFNIYCWCIGFSYLFRQLQNMSGDGRISSKNWKLYLPMWYVIKQYSMIFCAYCLFSAQFHWMVVIHLSTFICILMFEMWRELLFSEPKWCYLFYHAPFYWLLLS